MTFRLMLRLRDKLGCKLTWEEKKLILTKNELCRIKTFPLLAETLWKEDRRLIDQKMIDNWCMFVEFSGETI
jgi:hypothetical protein